MVIKLSSQVSRMTIGRAEMDKEYMNILCSMEKEKDHELNLMKARIKAAEESNPFLKVSAPPLSERTIDHEQQVGGDQKTLNEEQTPNWANGEGAKDQIVEKYNSEVNRNNLLEDQIQGFMAREDTTNHRLAEMKQDAEKSLLQKSKKIYTLKEELSAYKKNTIHLSRKLEEKEKEVEELVERDNNAVILVPEGQKLATTNLLEQLQKKEVVIDQMTQALNNLLSRQKNVPEQKYVEEIEDLKDKLQQKNAKIDCISFDNVVSLKEREANFDCIIQKHQLKLKELDEMRKRHEAELEQTINKIEQIEEDQNLEDPVNTNDLKHEACLRHQGLDLRDLTKKLTSVNVAKSEIEGNLKEFLDGLVKKGNSNNGGKVKLGLLETLSHTPATSQTGSLASVDSDSDNGFDDNSVIDDNDKEESHIFPSEKDETVSNSKFNVTDNIIEGMVAVEHEIDATIQDMHYILTNAPYTSNTQSIDKSAIRAQTSNNTDNIIQEMTTVTNEIDATIQDIQDMLENASHTTNAHSSVDNTSLTHLPLTQAPTRRKYTVVSAC